MIQFNEDGWCTTKIHGENYTIILYDYNEYSHLRIYLSYPHECLFNKHLPPHIDKYHPSLMRLYHIYLNDVDYERIYNNV